MKTEYELLIEYSELMTKKNLSGFRNNITNAHEFVAMAYEKTFSDYYNAVKIIRTLVITEKRRLIGLMQSQMIFDRVGEKRCGCCKQTKSFQEFHKRIDYSTNYQYFDSRCKDCLRENYLSEEYKERRRKTYANSPQQKRSARIRYERFRDKKKALKFKKVS
jgi:hypothetical protein